MGFTLDDLERLKVKLQFFDSKYLENGVRFEVGRARPGKTILKAVTMGFRLSQSDLTLDDLVGQN